jgi:hypothetical protein
VTVRLILLWLRIGAITIMVAAGVLLAVLLITYGLAAFVPSRAPPLDHARKIWALSALLGWDCALALLATAAWVFIETALHCFPMGGGSQCNSPR